MGIRHSVPCQSHICCVSIDVSHTHVSLVIFIAPNVVLGLQPRTSSSVRVTLVQCLVTPERPSFGGERNIFDIWTFTTNMTPHEIVQHRPRCSKMWVCHGRPYNTFKFRILKVGRVFSVFYFQSSQWLYIFDYLPLCIVNGRADHEALYFN